MAILHKTRVKETASNKPNASTAFSLPGSAATGYRTFASAYANNDQLPYHATNGTSWESGIGTFTTGPSTLTRTTILESSNTNAAVDFSAGADVELFVEWPAAQGTLSQVANESLIPGGRLTLESGVPVSTTDQLAKTTVYYTPYLHNGITLWDGVQWRPVEFTETSLALGTLTALLPYDVYAYLNAGVLTLELLAWTNATTRATSVTSQDGRYCKSSDKTRLLLGTIAPITTTTIEDSTINRLVANLYNAVPRGVRYSAGSSSHTWTPAGAALREYNGSSNVHVMRFVNAFTIDLPHGCFATLNSSTTASVSVLANLDSDPTVYPTAPGQPAGVFTSFTTANNWSSFGLYIGVVPGFHKITLCERVVSSGGYTLTGNFGSMWGQVLQ